MGIIHTGPHEPLVFSLPNQLLTIAILRMQMIS